MKKYHVVFDFQGYADSPAKFYAFALERMGELVARQRAQRTDLLLEGTDLPTGGLEGEPHGAGLTGWRCLFTLEEVRT